MLSAATARSRISAIFAGAFEEPSVRTLDAEQRRTPRHDAALSAQVVSGSNVYSAQIRNISAGGATLAFKSMPALFVGAQILVRAAGFSPFSGSIRWIEGNECGLAFNVALAEDMLKNNAVLFDPGKRARPGRARITLHATARAPGIDRRVTVENIGPGGAQISSGLPLSAPVGSGLMLEIAGIQPIGAYVRWARKGYLGLMFSKLLPLSAAEEIAVRCSIHPSWIKEVAAAHAALAGQRL